MQRATMTALIVLFLLFGVPLLEILVFIEIGGRIGGVATVVITVLTACVGMALFRSQSLNALEQTRTQLKIGEKLLEEVLGGLGLLLAALSLFIPGFYYRYHRSPSVHTRPATVFRRPASATLDYSGRSACSPW